MQCNMDYDLIIKPHARSVIARDGDPSRVYTSGFGVIE